MSVAREFDFPEPRPAKPLWLMTLADLALLLVGFLVLVQATSLDKAALARGIRAGFEIESPAATMPVAASVVGDFAPGSAVLAAAPTDTIAWARDVARDPRVQLQIAGAVDGSPADVDPATASATLLAADRARAVAAALIAARAIAPDRIQLATAARQGSRSGARRVLVTLNFTGDKK